MDIKLTSGSLSAELTLPDSTHTTSVKGTGITALADALQAPLGLPPLCQCSVPGDRIVIVVDPNTPQVAATINTVWEELHGSDLTELNITLLMPGDASGNEWKQLIEELPIHVRNQPFIFTTRRTKPNDITLPVPRVENAFIFRSILSTPT